MDQSSNFDFENLDISNNNSGENGAGIHIYDL